MSSPPSPSSSAPPLEDGDGGAGGSPHLPSLSTQQQQQHQQQQQQHRRPFIQGLPAAGGIRSSVLTLTASALGLAPLSLPCAMRDAGLGAGLLLLLLSTLVTALGGDVLVRCAAEQQERIRADAPAGLSLPELRARELATRSWTHLLEVRFGGPRAGALLDLLIALLGTGNIVSFFVFLSQFLVGVLGDAAPPRKVLLAVAAAAAFPPSLAADIGQARFLTLWSCAVLGLVAVMMLAGLAECGHAESPVAFARASPVLLPRAFALFYYAQGYHFNLYTIFSGLVAPHPWSPNYELHQSMADVVRMRKIIRYTSAMTLGNCALIAVPGYLLWREGTASNVMQNFSSRHSCGDAMAWFVFAVQILLSVNALVAVPIQLVPTRLSIIKLIGRAAGAGVEERCRHPPCRHLLTAAIVAGATAFAAALQDVADIIAFLAGLFCTVIYFLIPCLFYKWSALDSEAPCARAAVLLVLGAASCVGFGNVVALFLV